MGTQRDPYDSIEAAKCFILRHEDCGVNGGDKRGQHNKTEKSVKLPGHFGPSTAYIRRNQHAH
jgi:hypothetical protein